MNNNYEQNGHFLAALCAFWRVTNTSCFDRSYRGNSFSPTMTRRTLTVNKATHRFVNVTVTQTETRN